MDPPDRTLIDEDREISTPLTNKVRNFSHIVDLHITDLTEVGKPIRRSKRAAFKSLKKDLGRTQRRNLNRSTLIDYGKKHTKQGASPVTLSVDLSYIRAVLTHARAVHGITVDTECVTGPL